METRPQAVYKIKSDGYYNSWNLKCEIDIDNKTIKFDEEYKESVYVHGGKTDSSCEFAEGQLLLAVQAHNVILIAQNWEIIH